MRQVVAVAFYTLRELSRRKLLIFLVAGGAGLVLLAAILAALVRANAPAGTLPAKDFSGVLLLQVAGLVSLFAWIAAVAIAVTLINHDLESGSVVSIFSKPVSRLQYALGKLIAAAVALLLIVVVLGVGTQLLVLVNGGGHETALLKTLLLITANELTQMLIILVLTVLMNNIVAAGIGIVIMQVIKVVGTVNVLLHVAIDDGAWHTRWLRHRRGRPVLGHSEVSRQRPDPRRLPGSGRPEGQPQPRHGKRFGSDRRCLLGGVPRAPIRGPVPGPAAPRGLRFSAGLVRACLVAAFVTPSRPGF